MPELPEVETTRRGLMPLVCKQVVAKVKIRQPKLRWPVSSGIKSDLPGEKILDIERRGKYLLFKTAKGTAMIHLGMSGSLRVLSTEIPAEKHDHVDWVLGNGKVLRYTDPRRFGSILWSKKPIEQHKLLKSLGPEPLTENFTLDYFFDALKNRKTAIKVAIMNNHIVVGAGNIYACESLFKAKINPQRPANSISKKELGVLRKEIIKILKAAIEQGGTTLKDFQKVDGKPGYFSQQLQVYGREDEDCYICKSKIKKVVLGQRSTFYCGQCQKDE